MLVKVRCSDNKEWGFLEKYDSYRYNDTGYVRAVTSVTVDKKLAPCYAFKGDKFIPLREIEETVGIGKYIKAKKPFYSKLNQGYLVVLKAEVDFRNKVYFADKSTFEVYVLNGAPSNIESGVAFKRLLNVPKEFRDLVEEPLRVLGESFGDREKFLKERLDG